MRTPRKSWPSVCLAVSLLIPAVLCAVGPAWAAGRGVAKPAETYAFEMRDKPWSSVLEWLSDLARVPVISTEHPKGTFTFISPRKQTYTVPQIIDIINEALVSQKFLLIRRERSFTLVPADKPVDPAILPRIGIKDLDEHGNTEMVQVVMKLKDAGLVADELAPEIKKMMGPFGDVVAMESSNQLVLQDTVGNLRRVYNTIKDIADNEAGKAESFSHTCLYIKATDAERILEKLLGDPREFIRLQQQPQQQQQPQRNFGGAAGGGFLGVQVQPPPQQRPTVVTAKPHMWNVSADERTNTVLVTGPANKIAQAKEILSHIDVAEKGQQPIVVGQSKLMIYTVPNGHAEALAKTLGGIYKPTSSTNIQAAGNDTLIVFAGPEDQIAIAKQVLGSERDNKKTELIPLDAQDASKTAETLKGMFGDSKDPKSGGGAPYIEADTGRSAILVRGSAEQVAQVKAALKALGEEGLPSGNMRIITLDKGSAATLAEALGRLLPQMRQNPVNVIIPGRERKSSSPARPRPTRDGANLESRGRRGTLEFEPLVPVRAAADQLVDPRADKQKNDKPGKKNAPVTITAFGNRLIVTSDDPQALRLVQELTRLLTQAPKDAGDFEVIHLEHGNAADVAKVLDEAFNGTKAQATTNQPQFPPFFGNRGPAEPAKASEDRVRVVADTGTNSLLVRATPLDMLTIRRLLDQTLDTDQVNASGNTKTYIIPLEFAHAADVADVIRDVYREHMNTNPLPGQVGGFGGFRFLAAQAASNSNGKPVDLSVGVDSRTNSLVVSCSANMYKDIKKLAAQLDKGSKDTTRTVRVVPLKGVDPALVQRALDAIQGRRTTTGTGTSGIGTLPGAIGIPGFGPGGMQPGGGMQRGGGGPPGGGGPGGGQPGGGQPGGGRRFGGSQGRGPDFFADRVKD
ncbi:MAG TPA: secretin N-terminal domain-containing protein, partial [Gemmataceae bacterium]|nr:secretin N-terminal domain-containing protein [Gemmataceae bacterium]